MVCSTFVIPSLSIFVALVDEFFLFGILTDFIVLLVKESCLLDYIIQIRSSISMVYGTCTN